MPPMHTGLEYNNWHDCMIAGYNISIEKIESIGRYEVNQYDMFVKFTCAPLETI